MASFEIVEVTADGTIPQPHLGIFPDGKMAAGVVTSMLLFNPDKKYQPRPIMVSADWRKRELDKNHPPLPWGDALLAKPDHFAIVSDKDPDMVAYFASENAGKLDRRTSIHVNRYLLEFYTGLNIDERRRLVWLFTGKDLSENLRFASNPDDIVEVYEEGPNSCTSHSPGFYASGQNPTWAYGGPDLQIAYIVGSHGKPVARTVCWPEKKIYSRIYGDEEKLLPELMKLGYRCDFAAFEGARLLLRKAEGRFDEGDEYMEGYLCPYIDFAESVQPINGYLVVTRKGTYECQSQSGVAENNAKHCWHCKEMRNRGSFYETGQHPEEVCQDCAHQYRKVCAYEQNYIGIDSTPYSLAGGRYVGYYGHRHHTFVCLGNGQRYLTSEAVLYRGDKFSQEGLDEYLAKEARAA
ncbi:hypothetical protein NKJ88_05785 [Mesorhizobium sp. M0016]|uniref:hypothetical protein n=1 Tax=Mesorhizobium sp. M0016 TaxID=2956843 RepID=UPI0033384661